MAAVAIRREAFAPFRASDGVRGEAQEDAPHYCPDPNQTDLFHVSPEGDAEFRAEDAAESFGVDSVSSAPNLRSDQDRNAHAGGDRNFRVGQDRNLRSVLDQTFPIDEIGTHDFTEICGEALYAAYGRDSAPIKRIAEVANVNERTAKNWWERKCAPGPIHTLRLMAHVPGFQGRMRELTGMERDLDPELERSIMETVRLMQQRGLR